MDDAAFVGRVERVLHLAGNRERLGDRQRTPCDPIRERVALDVFEHQGADARGVLDAVNRGDVRMVERGQQPRFALEAGQAIGIAGPLGRQQLERDVAPEPVSRAR